MENNPKYQSIHHRINQTLRHYRIPFLVEKDTALNSLLDRIREGKSRPARSRLMPAWIRPAVAAAAVLFVLMISASLMFTRSYRNTGTEVATFRLPDDSRIILTAESSAKFSRLFRQRAVNLKGKAYFEVQNGNTFLVSTRKGKVEVLGTRFTVDERNNQLQVICFEGKIKASVNNRKVVLLPGSGINFKPGKTEEPLTTPEDYPGYARFSMNYSNTGLDTVLKDLESFFDIQVINLVAQPRYFTGNINTGNLQTAFSILTLSLQLNFRPEGSHSIVIY